MKARYKGRVAVLRSDIGLRLASASIFGLIIVTMVSAVSRNSTVDQLVFWVWAIFSCFVLEVWFMELGVKKGLRK